MYRAGLWADRVARSSRGYDFILNGRVTGERRLLGRRNGWVSETFLSGPVNLGQRGDALTSLGSGLRGLR